MKLIINLDAKSADSVIGNLAARGSTGSCQPPLHQGDRQQTQKCEIGDKCFRDTEIYLSLS
jgi:hypothetical protein